MGYKVDFTLGIVNGITKEGFIFIRWKLFVDKDAIFICTVDPIEKGTN